MTPTFSGWQQSKRGVDRFDKSQESFTHYKHDSNNRNSLSHNSVVTLFDDGNGVIWLPTYGGGLDRFDKKKKTFQNYRHEVDNADSIGSNALYEMIRTSAGELWLSRKGGISFFDPISGKFKNFHQDEHGIPFGPVGSLLEDNAGYLWLASVAEAWCDFIPRLAERNDLRQIMVFKAIHFFGLPVLSAVMESFGLVGKMELLVFIPRKSKRTRMLHPYC